MRFSLREATLWSLCRIGGFALWLPCSSNLDKHCAKVVENILNICLIF
jgi:hypothetical protein